MAKLLLGRSALITGSSQGLGYAIAQEFLQEGASVALCARDGALLGSARNTLAALASPGQRIIARPCDVSNKQEVEALVAWAVGELPELDVLVNSAGVYGPMGRVEDNEWHDWVRAIEINYLGAVLLCKSILPHLKRRGRGKIIQLSGGGATSPMPRLSAYAASKAAVVSFVESLAIDVRSSHIDVNAIAPGPLNTRMLEEVLQAGPEAVGQDFYLKSLKQKESGGASLEKGARLAAFLASRSSDGITGRLISALWDPWERLPAVREELESSDIYTLRRIVPRDRGKSWEEP